MRFFKPDKGQKSQPKASDMARRTFLICHWISVDKDLKDCGVSSDLYAHLLWALSWQLLQGVDGAKLELQEVVDFLKNPDKYTALGAKIPKVSSVSPMTPVLTLFTHLHGFRASVLHEETSAGLLVGIKRGNLRYITWRAWL